MKDKTFISPINSEDELQQWIEKSDRMLLIFDMHLAWSGRCESLVPSINDLCKHYESGDPESQPVLSFLSMEVPKLGPKFDSLVSVSPSCVLPTMTTNPEGGEKVTLGHILKKEGCSPLFIAVRARKVITCVEGANFPALKKAVEQNVPSNSGDADTS
jgi:hypothetical protein